MCIIVVLITLIPFDFHMPAKIRIYWILNIGDFITNIILFIPVGFLYKLGRWRNNDPLCLKPMVFGALFSLLIESVQQFIPSRFPQVSDIITNGLGAWLGGLIFIWLQKRLNRINTGKVFATELPIMNVVYLLIPLMWLNGLAAGGEISRLLLLLILVLFGAGVISQVYRFRLKNAGVFSIKKLSMLTMGWFLIGVGPMLLNFPIATILLGFLVWVFLQVFVRLPQKIDPAERRFELPSLHRLLPLYALYLLLLAVWPTTIPLGEWHININFQRLTFDEHILLTFRFIEFIAAFTLFGYIIAEMRGRKNESIDKTLGWIVCLSLICSIIITAFRGYSQIISSNILAAVIVIAASIYGGIIYRLQLAAIRRL